MLSVVSPWTACLEPDDRSLHIAACQPANGEGGHCNRFRQLTSDDALHAAATDAQHAAQALCSQTSGSLSAQYDRLHGIAQQQDAAAIFAAMQQAGSPFPRWRSGRHAAAAATLPSHAAAAVKAASAKFAPITASQREAQQALRLARRLAAAEWAEHWEDNSRAIVWRMDSVRRKRKHKMNKHKHRKRRKAQRHKT